MASSRIDQLKAFLDNDPEDAQARFLLGYEYNRQKQYEEAIPVLLRCVELDESNAAAWKQLGDAYRSLNRKDEALKAYQRGQEAGKNIGNAHTARECETWIKRLSKTMPSFCNFCRFEFTWL